MEFPRNGLRALALPSQSGLFPLQMGPRVDCRVGPVFQEPDQRLDGLQGVKHVAAAGDLRHAQGLSGPQAAARVANGGLGMEPAVFEFQQANAR